MARDTEKNQNKSLAECMEKLNKTFGDKVFKASQPTKFDKPVIKCPSPSLGEALHYWGIPLGMITQFYGPEGSGKTFLAMLCAAEVQRQFPGTNVVWVDAEHSFDIKWAAKIGIDLDRLIIIKEDNGSGIFSVLCGVPGKKDAKPKLGVLDLVMSGLMDVKLVVIDSIASIVPPVEQDRSFADQDIAALARFLPKAFRVMNSKGYDAQIATICINQAREKIGERIPTLSYPGGRAYRHMISVNVKLIASNAKESTLYDAHGKKSGHKIIATVEKTRGGANNHKAEFFLDFSKGVVRVSEELATLAAAYNVVQRPTIKTWCYGNVNITGKENFYAFLDDNPDVADKILNEVKEAKERGVERPVALSEDSAEENSVTIFDDIEGEGETVEEEEII